MDDIRILINFDSEDRTYSHFLTDKRFTIDERTITTIGTDNSADTLTEYDAIILNFNNPFTPTEDRILQLLSYINEENKLLVIILNKHTYTNEKQIHYY